MALSHRTATWILALVVVLNIALGAANAWTRAPWWDEGIIVSPAYNLAHHGVLGTTVQHGRGLGFIEYPQYDRYTYWALPVYLLALAAWIKVFGASIFATRALSILCGAVMVVAWYLIVRRLVESRLAGLMAALFVSVDFTVITAASNTRMDAMAAALGTCGIAAYLALRRRNLGLAVLVGNTFTAAALLTHPTGAVQIVVLLVLIATLDWRALRFSFLPLIAAPYIVFLASWGIYVLQAPSVAVGQLHAQAGNRVGGVKAPWRAIITDFRWRYWWFFFEGLQGAKKFKALMLLEYMAGAGALLAFATLRRQRGFRSLLWMAAAAYVALAVIDGVSSPHYLIETCPCFAAVWGAVAAWALEKRRLAAPVLALSAAFLAVHIGASVQRAREDARHRIYQPVIQFLQSHGAGTRDRIIGASELWFGLGPHAALMDDMRLGYYSGWRPEWIVTNGFYEETFKAIEAREPIVWQHICGVLSNFDEVFSSGDFKVYHRRGATALAAR